MNESVQQVVNEIDRKIADLQDLKRRLTEEFSENTSPEEVHRRRKRTAYRTADMSLKEKFYGWLEDHGPAFTREIYEGTNENRSSTSATLHAHKHLFKRDNEGKWRTLPRENTVAEASTNGEGNANGS